MDVVDTVDVVDPVDVVEAGDGGGNSLSCFREAGYSDGLRISDELVSI